MLPKHSTPVFSIDDSNEPVLPEEYLTREFLSNAQEQSRIGNGTGRNSSPGSRANSSNSPQEPLMGSRHLWRHRLYLSILGACLPFLGLNYFLLYFILWEVAMVGVSRGIPFPPSQPNMFLTLVMVLGLKDEDVQRLKFAIRVAKWLCTDFCFFFMSVVIPQIGINLFSSTPAEQHQQNDQLNISV